MRIVPHALLLSLLLASAEARVAETRGQTIVRYGEPRPPTLAESVAPILKDASELVFERNGWRIRCALLRATDGEFYVVREEWRRADGAAIDESLIASFLTDLQPAARWSESPSRLKWSSPDGLEVSMNPIRKAITVNLPQALKHEAAARPKPVFSAAGTKKPTRVNEPAKKPTKNVSPTPLRSAVTELLAAIKLGIGWGLLLAAIAVAVSFLGRRMRSTQSRRPLERSVVESNVQTSAPVPTKRTLRDLDWQEFELLVGEIYRRQGYEVELCTALGPDGGSDLVLHKNGMRTLVQCKKWNAWKVGPKEIREFFGTLIDSGAPSGIFVTTQQFTRDAQEFAAGKPIELVDGAALEQMVREINYAAPGDLMDLAQWTPDFFAAAKLVVPTCPFCKTEMTLRKTATPFWSCTSWPRCSGKREHRMHAPIDETAFVEKVADCVACSN